MSKKRMHDGTKLLYHMPRVMAHFDKGERVPPIHLDCGISKWCSISCVWCYGFFQNVQKTHIEREALINMLSDANEIGVLSLAFIGDGEPTTNPYCFDALEYARDKTTLDMAISTNGVALNTDEKCNTVLSSCKWMRFCIGAGTREGYLNLHRMDFFSRVKTNIQNMIRIKKEHGYECEVGLQTVFMPGLMNKDTLDLAKMAVDLGVSYFVIKQYSRPDDGESGMAVADLDEYDSPQTQDALHRCEDLSTPDTDIIVKWKVIANKGKKNYQGCPSLPFISEVSGNGDWMVCGHFFGGKPGSEKYLFGNLQKQRMRDIYASDHYWNIIKEMRHEFNSQKSCRGACRQDLTNEFCWEYLNKPLGINFI